jgi:hypothetical protein
VSVPNSVSSLAVIVLGCVPQAACEGWGTRQAHAARTTKAAGRHSVKETHQEQEIGVELWAERKAR